MKLPLAGALFLWLAGTAHAGEFARLTAISRAEIVAAGAWNPFEAPEPPLLLTDAIKSAQHSLDAIEKHVSGTWRLAPAAEGAGELLHAAEADLWIWRLTFVFAPDGAFIGPYSSRTVVVLMNGRCLPVSSCPPLAFESRIHALRNTVFPIEPALH